MNISQNNENSRSVIAWMWIVLIMIALMVIVGGGTRLTGSGLSMVQWHPFMGTLPPLNNESWLQTFTLYKQSPQYLEVNTWMQLADFKRIFMWEYLHRLLGRMIGLVVFFPLIFFWLKNKMSTVIKKRMLVAFFLGGAQGFLGWFMVKSGLSDRPEVSHFRLAAHLSLAFFVGMWILWSILIAQKAPKAQTSKAQAQKDHLNNNFKNNNFKNKKILAVALLVLTSLQIVWGAFMAGSRAGYLYKTFPDMNGELIPSMIVQSSNSLSQFWNEATAIHFMHRILAYLVVIVILYVAHFLFWKAQSSFEKKLGVALLLAVSLQFILGILTVMLGVQIHVAVSHQLGSFILLSLVVLHLYYYFSKSTTKLNS